MVIYYSPSQAFSSSRYHSESDMQRYTKSPNQIRYRTSDTPNAQHHFTTPQSQPQSQSQQQQHSHVTSRPMTFMKALEMSNEYEKDSTLTRSTLPRKDLDSRKSQYEISV